MLCPIYVLEVQRQGVRAWLIAINVAYPVRCQVDLAILLIGELQLPTGHQVSKERIPHEVSFGEDALGPHPSYRPTLSCTKRRTSSGRYEGRSAVVRSICFKNIRHSGAVDRVEDEKQTALSLRTSW